MSLYVKAFLLCIRLFLFYLWLNRLFPKKIAKMQKHYLLQFFFLLTISSSVLFAQNADLLAEAQKSIEAQNYFKAMRQLDDLLKEKPTSARAHFMKGLCEYKLENPKAALEHFDYAILYQPDYLEAYYNRGLIQAGMQEHTLAIKDFDAILSKNPNITPVYRQRALSFFALQQRKEASRDFTKITQLDPRNKEAHYYLALIAQQEETATTDILKHLNQALEIDKQYENALLMRVEIYFAQQALEKVELDAAQLIQLNPYNWRAYYLYAEALLARKAFKEAKENLEKILLKQSEYADAYYCLGKIALAENKTHIACQHWQKAKTFKHPEAEELLKIYCKNKD